MLDAETSDPTPKAELKPEGIKAPHIPSLADSPSKRTELAARLTDLIEAGESAKGGAPRIWAEIERMFRSEPEASVDSQTEGDAVTHIPIMTPRLRDLAAKMTGIVLGQEPCLLASTGDEEESTQLENVLQDQLVKGGIGRAVRQAAVHALLTNKAVYRLTFDLVPRGFMSDQIDGLDMRPKGPIAFGGLKVVCFHPEHFVIAPTTLDGIQSAMLVGHRFYRRAKDIIMRQGLGLYFKDETQFMPSTETEKRPEAYAHAQVSPDVFSSYPETEAVECFECYVKLSPKEGALERWYKATVAVKERLLLDFQDWPFSRPPYFTCGAVVDTVAFWGSQSVGRELAPLQSEYDHIHSSLYNAVQRTANPPIFGPPLFDEEYTETGAGDYIETDGTAQPWAPTVHPNLAPLAQLLADIERLADITVGTSTNSLGAEEARQTTATQTQAIQMGMANRLMDYLAVFTEPLPAMAAFGCELLLHYYPLWAPFAVSTVNMSALTKDVKWEVNGRSPQTTPTARMQTAQVLWGMAQNPMSGIDPYEVAKLFLTLCGLPGAKKLQVERNANPQTISGGAPGPTPAPAGGPPPLAAPGGNPVSPIAANLQPPHAGGPIAMSPGAGQEIADLRAS